MLIFRKPCFDFPHGYFAKLFPHVFNKHDDLLGWMLGQFLGVNRPVTSSTILSQNLKFADLALVVGQSDFVSLLSLYSFGRRKFYLLTLCDFNPESVISGQVF